MPRKDCHHLTLRRQSLHRSGPLPHRQARQSQHHRLRHHTRQNQPRPLLKIRKLAATYDHQRQLIATQHVDVPWRYFHACLLGFFGLTVVRLASVVAGSFTIVAIAGQYWSLPLQTRTSYGTCCFSPSRLGFGSKSS